MSLILILPAIHPVSAQTQHSFLLNTNHRLWSVNGSLESEVIDWDGWIRVKPQGAHPFTINVYPGDIILINVDDTDNEGRLWIGRDGWNDWHNIGANSIYVNGMLAAENVEIINTNYRTGLTNLNSSIGITVNRNPSGWTRFLFDGETILHGGNDNSEIIVQGASPTNHRSLNINIRSGYAEGGSNTAFVNSAEVPELGSPLGFAALMLMSLLIALLGYKIKVRKI